MGIFQLINAFQAVIKRVDAREDLREIFGEHFTVSDKIEWILQSRRRWRAASLFGAVRIDGVAGRDRGHIPRFAGARSAAANACDDSKIHSTKSRSLPPRRSG
ncbi:MAG: hypothetical protein WKF47_06480 [Geodermatophilaceae bacterium]